MRVPLPASGLIPEGVLCVGSGKTVDPRALDLWSEGWDLLRHSDRQSAAAAYISHHEARPGMLDQLWHLEGWKLSYTSPIGRLCRADTLVSLFHQHKDSLFKARLALPPSDDAAKQSAQMQREAWKLSGCLRRHRTGKLLQCVMVSAIH